MLILLALLAQAFVLPQLTVSKSAGCGTTAPFTGLTTQTSPTNGVPADGDGTNRSALWRVGTSYVNTTAAPLAIGLHEAGGTSAGADGWGITQAAGPAANWISILPQGITSQTFGVGWNSALPTKGAKDQYSECGGCTPAQTARDALWVVSLVQFAEAHFCIDQNRIFVFGFSWGADFATSLVCGYGVFGNPLIPGGIFRAGSISAAGGDLVPDGSGQYTDYLNWKGLGGCPAYAHFRHTYDDSGTDAAGGGNIYPDLYTAATMYRVMNKCNVTSSRNLSCNEWQGCKAQTVDCPVNGLGHSRPGSWGADTVAFFQRF